MVSRQSPIYCSPTQGSSACITLPSCLAWLQGRTNPTKAFGLPFLEHTVHSPKELLCGPVQAGWRPPGGQLSCLYSLWFLLTLSQKSFPSSKFSPVCRCGPYGVRVMRGWTAVPQGPLLMSLGYASLLPEGPSGNLNAPCSDLMLCRWTCPELWLWRCCQSWL